MQITSSQPDGLYIPTSATLAQLLEDEPVHDFADRLLHAALFQTYNLLQTGRMQSTKGIQSAISNLQSPISNAITLAQALHYPGPEMYPLLTALLALDAEVRAAQGDETRVIPLPGFLSYRASLPPDKAPLQALRLPPLNQGGHYHLAVFDNGEYGAVRFDLHPELHLAGHVRLALSSLTRFPMRLLPIEEHLNRQVLTEALIEEVIAVGGEEISPPLVAVEKAGLLQACQALWQQAIHQD